MQKKQLVLWIALLSLLIAWIPSSKSSDTKTGAEARVKVVLEDWTDKTRSRQVPVKLYIPNGSGPFPLVVFSHGLGGSRDAATYLGEYWAAHGILGVFVQHLGSDTSVWKTKDGHGKQEFVRRMQAAANAENGLLRVQDIKFVLDEIERRKNDPALRGHLDLDKIAIAGHSFGGGTSLTIAGENYGLMRENTQNMDGRVKAAIYLCPHVSQLGKLNPGKAYGHIKIPGLLLTGNEDNSPIGQTKAEERRIPFDGIKAPHQYLVNFIGADHFVFSGRGFRQPKPDDEKFQSMVQEVSTHFLQAALYGDKSAWQWLDGDGIVNFLGGSAKFERK